MADSAIILYLECLKGLIYHFLKLDQRDINNKKMQHSSGVTYSIALSYQFPKYNYLDKPISFRLNTILYEFIESRVAYMGTLSNYSLGAPYDKTRSVCAGHYLAYIA